MVEHRLDICLGIVFGSWGRSIIFQLSCIFSENFMTSQFWRRFHNVVRNKYIFAFAWNIMEIYLSSIWVITPVSIIIPLFSFCLDDISIGDSGELKSLTNSFEGGFGLSFSNLSFMSGCSTFGAQILRMYTLSLWIFPLRNMKWPYTSILINFVWKSILFNIRPIKPVCFLCPFPCKISSQTFTWKKIFQCWDMVFVCCKMMGSVFISIL